MQKTGKSIAQNSLRQRRLKKKETVEVIPLCMAVQWFYKPLSLVHTLDSVIMLYKTWSPIIF